MGSLADRFWSKVRVTPGCWEWRAERNKDGYGLFLCMGRMVRAHRFSWELVNGSIPEGLVIRHRCDNPPCVNPDHLRSGTQADNIADMIERGRHAPSNRTHCPRGHARSAENTYTNPAGKRSCRPCTLARSRQRRAWRTYLPNIK